MQPVTVTAGRDSLGWQNLLDEAALHYGRTNYAGCSGAVSGGELDNPELHKFRGMMSSGKLRRMAHVRDGASRSIMYGEILGHIVDGRREYRINWLTGALARGRPSDFAVCVPPLIPFIGDGQNASRVNFASVHPMGANFAYGDGSVASISRAIDWRIVYAKCGIADGQLAEERH